MAVAIHEAGHAVVMRFLEIPFQSVSIVQEGIFAGGVSPQNLGKQIVVGHITPKPRDKAERQVLATFAGVLAEKQHTGKFNRVGFIGANKAHPVVHPTSDHHKIMEWVHLLSNTEREEPLYYRWLRCRAEDIVSRPERWAAIQALANVLVRRKHLEYAEAEEIIIEAVQRFRLQSQKMKAKLV